MRVFDEKRAGLKYQYIDKYNNKELYDATKFYKFKKIPNVLFIQLKRFKYDLESNDFNKINNGISFKEEIDLSDYLDKRNYSKKRKTKEEYVLYCIIKIGRASCRERV